MLKKILISTGIFLICLEFLLRVSGTFRSYNENTLGGYIYKYRIYMPTWYHTWKPNTTIDYEQPEFKYVNTFNELGHRETRFSSFIADSTTRKVVCIGDSFTEGDGSPADSTWVKTLEKLLHESGHTNYRFYNAGVCGSDVFLNNKMLENKLLPINPDVVIECVNTSDINDVVYRGGSERFNDDGSAKGKTGPRWEVLYKFSYVFRAFVHTFLRYNSNLIIRKEVAEKEAASVKLIAAQVQHTKAFCDSHHIKYVLLVHPAPEQVNAPFPDRSRFVESLTSNFYSINLFPAFNEYYKNNDIEKNRWKMNGHYNSTGYNVMGHLIFDALKNKQDSLWR